MKIILLAIFSIMTVVRANDTWTRAADGKTFKGDLLETTEETATFKVGDREVVLRKEILAEVSLKHIADFETALAAHKSAIVLAWVEIADLPVRPKRHLLGMALADYDAHVKRKNYIEAMLLAHYDGDYDRFSKVFPTAREKLQKTQNPRLYKGKLKNAWKAFAIIEDFETATKFLQAYAETPQANPTNVRTYSRTIQENKARVAKLTKDTNPFGGLEPYLRHEAAKLSVYLVKCKEIRVKHGVTVAETESLQVKRGD